MIKRITRGTASSSAQPVRAASSITSGVRNNRSQGVTASTIQLSPEKRAFANQLKMNIRRKVGVTAATNTTNIMARPDFLELLPMFVQELLVLDVAGSVAMKSRQQLIPYFKFIAENDKGETAKGTILNSPFVNRQGKDPNFTGRVVKNETIAADEATEISPLAYTPVIPGSVTLVSTASGVATVYTDDGKGGIVDDQNAAKGYIDYSTGLVDMTEASLEYSEGDTLKATYQYDNENVGPDADGHYGAKMAKGYLQLDEFDLRAEARELACYWSVYSAFAAQQEYGANIGDIAREAAISELTAEINTDCFLKLKKAASFTPAFNWDVSPVASGAVVPSDYLNMFKLKLGQASAAVYQRTRLTTPNRLIVGTEVGNYIKMVNGFRASSNTDHVGPYKLGDLDEFGIYVCPDYDPMEWVMSCKSSDIRRNSALFGEYMPIANSDAIGLANASVQQGTFSMYGFNVVNPDTVVRGKITGAY